ncbi:MAG: hypothetical protein LBG48_00280 [Rickettsiales bacterium]|jgi:hypothetical protein|nr:hypothetical protein [Rickettsiales bacterium]
MGERSSTPPPDVNKTQKSDSGYELRVGASREDVQANFEAVLKSINEFNKKTKEESSLLI